MLLEGLGLTPAAPFLLVHGEGATGADLAAVVNAHRYWRASGLPIATVIVAEEPGALPPAAVLHGGTEGLHLLEAESLGLAGLEALAADARLVVDGPLPIALSAGLEPAPLSPALAPCSAPATTREREPLQCANGLGGFSADGTEYVLELRHANPGGIALPPLPWVNVLANGSCSARS